MFKRNTSANTSHSIFDASCPFTEVSGLLSMASGPSEPEAVVCAKRTALARPRLSFLPEPEPRLIAQCNACHPQSSAAHCQEGREIGPAQLSNGRRCRLFE